MKIDLAVNTDHNRPFNPLYTLGVARRNGNHVHKSIQELPDDTLGTLQYEESINNYVFTPVAIRDPRDNNNYCLMRGAFTDEQKA